MKKEVEFFCLPIKYCLRRTLAEICNKDREQYIWGLKEMTGEEKLDIRILLV
jgi:hypothetical protein